MKNILLILGLGVVSLGSFAQISVSEYEKAFKVDANNVPAADVVFTSSCGDVQVEVSEKMASGGCIGNLIRTYKATDSCGNEASAEQYLSLQDKEGPEIFGVPEDITVSADANLKTPVVGAIDLGNKSVEVTMSETRKDKLLIRTWSATDKCGNKSEKTQQIRFK